MKIRPILSIALFVFLISLPCSSQSMPSTSGETLSGKRVTPADLVRGHAAILVAGFSHDAGMQCGPWMKVIEGDPALKDVNVLELAMLEKAPGILRGMIKSGMRKGASPAEQNQIVVITQDQDQWEKFFGLNGSDDARKDPYVLVLNAKGEIVWHGHGQAQYLEPELEKALPSR